MRVGIFSLPLSYNNKLNKVMKYQVKQTDLKGKIAQFPIEVVEKMVDEQRRQGNGRNVNVFQTKVTADVEEGGFSWGSSADGYLFWESVILDNNFDAFFAKYPKHLNLYYLFGKEGRGFDVIKTLEKRGGINNRNYVGDVERAIYYIEPRTNEIRICYPELTADLAILIQNTYTRLEIECYMRKISVKEIAKKFDIDLNTTKLIITGL